jgi:hypothetical protein
VQVYSLFYFLIVVVGWLQGETCVVGQVFYFNFVGHARTRGKWCTKKDGGSGKFLTMFILWENWRFVQYQGAMKASKKNEQGKVLPSEQTHKETLSAY